uniref:Uncharacterized protein n=1 Tax=Rhizophora mucronata TaxID=61149 RepID=A0A2P2PCQ5_RHIMU
MSISWCNFQLPISMTNYGKIFIAYLDKITSERR